MSRELIKQDINFLENPLWFQDEKLAKRTEDGFVWKDKDGFIYRAGYRPPVKTDMIFLLYLLIQSQKQKWAEKIQLSRYQIMTDCGVGTDAWWYERLEDSLKRWKMVGIEFHGMFYDKKEYITKMFGIIDDWEIDKKTKLLKVRLSPSYLLKVKESTFFRYIDFDQVKALRSPLSTRLYEILVKTFKNRDIWKIDAIRLAEKIPMNEKYPAHIALKIQPAVNRISNHTDLKIGLELDKKRRGKIVFIFHKLAIEKPKNLQNEETKKKIKSDFIVPEDMEFKNLIAILPFERQCQKSLLETLYKAFKTHGFDYIAWNIKYANKHAIGNYPAYLIKAIKYNYGQTLKEEEEVQKHISIKRLKEDSAKTIQMSEEQAKELEKEERAEAYLKSISKEELEALERKAYGKYPTFLKTGFERVRKERPISFQSLLRISALEKLDGKDKNLKI